VKYLICLFICAIALISCKSGDESTRIYKDKLDPLSRELVYKSSSPNETLSLLIKVDKKDIDNSVKILKSAGLNISVQSGEIIVASAKPQVVQSILEYDFVLSIEVNKTKDIK
jgi:hypothetical protein